MDGRTLIEWGFTPGPWFKEVLPLANQMIDEGADEDFIRAWVGEQAPPDMIPLRTNSIPFAIFANPANSDEQENISSVVRHMDELMRVPTIRAGAVMPDACPAGSAPGTIPVGGVVACENAIHPGFHSADICCSVAISVLARNVDVGKILDTAAKVSHFGPGGRKDQSMKVSTQAELNTLIDAFAGNPFLKDLEGRARWHFMTQGDGNHFFFVGDLNGETVIVTHHGSAVWVLTSTSAEKPAPRR
jgi:hypothetical protein